MSHRTPRSRAVGGPCFQNVRVRRWHRDPEGSASAAVAGRRRAVVASAGLGARRPAASICNGALPAGQPTRARSRTIRTLLVRASRRSMAAARSLGGDSVDQRLPTRRTSPRRSRSFSRSSALWLLIPAARAAIAVENEPGSIPSAARSRSGCWSGPRSPGRRFGGTSGSAMAGKGSTGAKAGVPPADRHQSGHGSCRTTRPAPARPGARAQTDAIHDQSGRRRSAVRHSRSRSGLHYATALSPHHRTSTALSRGSRPHRRCERKSVRWPDAEANSQRDQTTAGLPTALI